MLVQRESCTIFYRAFPPNCNQNYPWGRRGTDSLAATLCSKTPNTGFKIEDKEYAEMWMGDYPVLPAKSLKTGEELQKIVDENKEQLLGKTCISKFGGVVPFLPKILSIAKALPLQIHPDKALAEKLHAQNPDQFTDSNHKPEIAIALDSPFEVFAGWKPTPEIQSLFTSLPPLHQFLPSTTPNFDDSTIRTLVSNILKASDATIRSTQESLQNTPREKYTPKYSYILDLLPHLQSQYAPTDPGNLVALLTMNFLSLPAGSAIYVPASCPHAYLSGNIVECMARSNNVLNTGFCPRPDRDNIDLFCSDLTFSAHSPDDVLLPAEKSEKGKCGKTSVYAPPMSEFDMLRVVLGGKDGDKEVVQALGGPAVAFCVKGEGKLRGGGRSWSVERGMCFLWGRGRRWNLSRNRGWRFIWLMQNEEGLVVGVCVLGKSEMLYVYDWDRGMS